jgi:ribosome-interacting GTPase 1
MSDQISILKEKIARIEADLVKTQTESGTERKRITLIDYLAYLQDELRMLENDDRLRDSTRR